jgi:hypothetical protein
MSTQSPSSTERRSFLNRLNIGLASFAAMAGIARAQEKSAAPGRFQPARHEKDDWLDQLPGKHRLLFDTTAPDGFGDALFFANNFVRTNRTDYGLESNELAVVIVARHSSTGFAYNDAMWAKYGMILAELAKFDDPKTKMPPKTNLYNAAGYGPLMTNRGVSADAVSKLGVQFAVCSVSTGGWAGSIAAATGGNRDAVLGELTSNLVTNARMVPAGIVAVSRAQERGYTLVST